MIKISKYIKENAYDDDVVKKFYYYFLGIFPYIIAIVAGTNLGNRIHFTEIAYAFFTIMIAAKLFYKKSIRFTDSLKKTVFAMALFTFFIFLSAFRVGRYELFTVFAIEFMSIFTLCDAGFDEKVIRLIGYSNACFSFIIIINFYLGGVIASWNTNYAGLMVVIGLFWMFIVRKINKSKHIIFDCIIIMSIFTLLLTTDSRTSVLGILIYIIFDIVLPKKILLKKWVYRIFYSVILSVPVIVVNIIMALWRSQYVDKLNELSYKYTEKLFFSGREEIWDSIFKHSVSEVGQFFLGEGRILAANTHNFFVYIFFFFGALGIASYLIFLISIFEYLHKYFYDSVIVSCTLIFFCIYAMQSTEVVMSMNNNVVPYMFLSVAIGRSLILNKQNNTEVNELNAKKTKRNNSGLQYRYIR